MRTERPMPWGFDERDPRLELRQAAAKAQRAAAAAEAPAGEDPDDSDDTATTEPRELETVGAGADWDR